MRVSLVSLTEVFYRAFFISCKANARAQHTNARVRHTQTGHSTHSSYVRWLNVTATLSNFNFRHGPSGFESQKAFQPKLCPPYKAYCLLSNGPQFAPVAVKDRDGKSLA